MWLPCPAGEYVCVYWVTQAEISICYTYSVTSTVETVVVVYLKDKVSTIHIVTRLGRNIYAYPTTNVDSQKYCTVVLVNQTRSSCGRAASELWTILSSFLNIPHDCHLWILFIRITCFIQCHAGKRHCSKPTTVFQFAILVQFEDMAFIKAGDTGNSLRKFWTKQKRRNTRRPTNAYNPKKARLR